MVEELVAKVGSTNAFPPSVAYYWAMVDAECRVDGTGFARAPGDLAITDSDLAFLCLILKNYLPVWRYDWENGPLKQDDQGKDIPDPKRPDTVYTDASGGSNPFGGWSSDARKIYRKLKALFMDARAKDHDRLLQVDSECLTRIRVAKGYDVRDAKKKKGKKPKTQFTPDSNSEDELAFT